MTANYTKLNSALNIGLLTPSFRGYNVQDGGIASHFAELADALAAEGHRVTVITSAPRTGSARDTDPSHIAFAPFAIEMPRWLDRVTGLRWQLHSLAGLRHRAWRAARKLSLVETSRQLDIIETTSSGVLGLSYLQERHRAPIVTRISTTAAQLVEHNNSHPRWPERVEQRWERQLVEASDARLTHTEHHREAICQQWSLTKGSIALVPHGITLPPAEDLPTTHDNTDVQVLFVGRFEHRKGIDTLLESIPLVLTRCQTVRFRLIGADAGNWRSKFWESHPTLRREQVEFSGNVGATELQAAYRNCDLFVAPSRYESFGLIYAEAMAWGKAAIGCRVGGVPEVIEHGATGYVIPPESPNALADAIVALVHDRNLRAAMGQAARARVEKHFSHAALAAGSVALYSEVIAATAERRKTR